MYESVCESSILTLPDGFARYLAKCRCSTWAATSTRPMNGASFFLSHLHSHHPPSPWVRYVVLELREKRTSRLLIISDYFCVFEWVKKQITYCHYRSTNRTQTYLTRAIIQFAYFSQFREERNKREEMNQSRDDLVHCFVCGGETPPDINLVLYSRKQKNDKLPYFPFLGEFLENPVDRKKWLISFDQSFTSRRQTQSQWPQIAQFKDV